MYLAATETLAARALSVRPLVWLGQISYSLYLWHFPIIDTTAGSAHAVRAGFSVLVAWLSYRFVEQPFMRRRKHPVLVPVPAIAS